MNRHALYWHSCNLNLDLAHKVLLFVRTFEKHEMRWGVQNYCSMQLITQHSGWHYKFLRDFLHLPIIRWDWRFQVLTHSCTKLQAASIKHSHSLCCHSLVSTSWYNFHSTRGCEITWITAPALIALNNTLLLSKSSCWLVPTFHPSAARNIYKFFITYKPPSNRPTITVAKCRSCRKYSSCQLIVMNRCL